MRVKYQACNFIIINCQNRLNILRNIYKSLTENWVDIYTYYVAS